MTRQEAIDILKDVTIEDWQYGDYEALDMAIQALEQMQIPCKDCKHWHEWEHGAGSCHRSDIMWVGTNCDDYCSFAEGK